MKAATQKLLISMILFMLVTSCLSPKATESQHSPSSPSPRQNNKIDEPLETSQPNESSQHPVETTQEPFVLPQGYQAIETSSFKLAIPKEWSYKAGSASDSLVFQKDGEELGQTEILGWFDSNTWKDMKPNHSEQKDFQEVEGLLSISGMNVHTYRIQLSHTKPAAEQDPDWAYKETRWYVAVKEKGCSYGFYFSSGDVDESIMETIVSTFRL